MAIKWPMTLGAPKANKSLKPCLRKSLLINEMEGTQIHLLHDNLFEAILCTLDLDNRPTSKQEHGGELHVLQVLAHGFSNNCGKKLARFVSLEQKPKRHVHTSSTMKARGPCDSTSSVVKNKSPVSSSEWVWTMKTAWSKSFLEMSVS